MSPIYWTSTSGCTTTGIGCNIVVNCAVTVQGRRKSTEEKGPKATPIKRRSRLKEPAETPSQAPTGGPGVAERPDQPPKDPPL